MARPIDRRDVDRLVVVHLPAALRLALRLSGDAETAEDVVQEALCRVLRQWRTFRGESAFRTWMLQIVVNVDRDRRRRTSAATPAEGAWPEPVAAAASPHEQAAARELDADIRAAVQRLPERQREVAALVWGEGLAAGDVARILQTTESNVYANLHLARQHVAQAIGFDFARHEPS